MKACPLCGNPQLAQRDVHAAHCPRCDLLVNLKTAPLDYGTGGGQAVPDAAKMRWRIENARRRFTLLDPFIDDVAAFVDIGCGSGEMLEVAARRIKLCIGFDTNRPLIEHIRRSGRAIAIDGHFDAAALPPEAAGKRTLFALSHVLEHLESPLELVRQVVAAMTPGDLIYVEVPLHTGQSFRQLGYKWSLWNHEHVMLFSPLALSWLATASGLETLASGTRIFARGSRSTKTKLRLLARHPIDFLRTTFTKGAHSFADMMIADYGYLILRKKGA